MSILVKNSTSFWREISIVVEIRPKNLLFNTISPFQTNVVKEKTPIIIEAGLGNPNPKGVNPPSGVKHSKSSNSATSQHVIGEDVHPYLRQLEQALELEVKYRVPVGDNPQGEMSGGITSGMRDGSAHVLRCLKV